MGERRGKWRGPTEAERFATGRDGPRTTAMCRKRSVDVSHVPGSRVFIPSPISLFDICVYKLLRFISLAPFALSSSFRTRRTGVKRVLDLLQTVPCDVVWVPSGSNDRQKTNLTDQCSQERNREKWGFSKSKRN